MYKFLFILFGFFILVGVLFNYLLYRQDRKKDKDIRFITSERLLLFGVEILVAIIGFGLTLSIANYNERQVEKENAIQMMSQVIEFTDRQLDREKNYLNMYKKGTISAKGLRNSNVISLEYYYNVLSIDTVLQNTNMNTYGDMMTYLQWIEQRNQFAREASEEHIYTYLKQRYNHLIKFRELLSVCHDELAGIITAEEAKQNCHDIKYDAAAQEATSVAETTPTATTEATLPPAA